MQSVNPAPLVFEIRPPWKDEQLRVREFIPQIFQRAAHGSLLVAVQGSLERIIAAIGIIPPVDATSSPTLHWRIAGERYRVKELLRSLFAEASKRYAGNSFNDRLRVAQMLDEESLEVVILRELGFQTDAVHDVYEIAVREVWDRLDRLHRRLIARGIIPPKSKVAHLTTEMMPEAATFLSRHLPGGEAAFLEENESYKLAHSYVLLLDGAIKGLLLSHITGAVSNAGVILVARELRGGYGWANIALTYESLREGLDYGLETLRFTADPLLHPNTVGFARAWGGRRVGGRARLFLTLPF